MNIWKKFMDSFIPTLWGVLWVLIITLGSFAVLAWVIKLLAGLL